MNLKNLSENEIAENENVKKEKSKNIEALQKEVELLKYEISIQRRAIKKIVYHQKTQPPLPWMDMAETIQTLNIAERTVHSHIEKGILGRSWLGGKLYFNRQEIEEELKRNYQKNE